MAEARSRSVPRPRTGAAARGSRQARPAPRAHVIWLYGLSGSGKSTLAAGLERRLRAGGVATVLLDGDVVRAGLNRDLGFSAADRAENIRRVAEVARLFVQAGVVVVAAFITPTRALRALARGIIGASDFTAVYVEASWATCRRRDPKGLYARAGRGEVRQFTGKDAPFEPPERADLAVNTEADPVARSLARLHALVGPRLRRRIRRAPR
ncbi:MAG TPA: adenylyl-sulfate kinase [Opitutaceae bacterium]|nr:adenylyl-sulfate kinase [Opitutaceae bacterium]